MVNYPTRKLGRNGPEVSAVGFGAMGIGAYYGKSDEEETMKVGELLEIASSRVTAPGHVSQTLTYAADRGMTFWDTSDYYGTSEETIGKWFTQTKRRSEIFLCTKFGGFDSAIGKANSNPSYIQQSLKRSLEALKTDYIDLYYQHRTDPDVPIEVVMKTLEPFVKSGQVKWIGLSECTPATVKRAKPISSVADKLVALQMEFSPFELMLEKIGYVDMARSQGMAVVAYSPLARGMASGRIRVLDDLDEDDSRRTMPRFLPENFHKNLEVADKIKDIADKLGATPAQVTLAWILAEHPDFIPIPGCRTVARLEENASAAELRLSDADVKAIRALAENADVKGERYAEDIMSATMVECVPLDQWKQAPP